MRLIKLIAKNFLILARSRISSLIIIFGPLAIMLLAGFAFNNNQTFELTIGTYAPDASNLTAQYQQTLATRFQVLDYPDQESCVQDVKQLKTHGCIVFSPDFNIRQNHTNTLDLFVDNSKVNIVDLIKNALSGSIETQSTQISKDLTQVLIVSINDAQTQLKTWSLKDIVQLKSGTSQASQTANQTRSRVDSQDSTYPDKKSYVDSVSAGMSAVDASIKSLSKNLSSSLNALESTLENIGDENTTTDIEAFIDEGMLVIADARLAIDNSSTSANLTRLSSAISNLTAYITALTQKLDAMAVLKKDVATSVATQQSQLTTLYDQLDALSLKFVALDLKLATIQVKDAQSITNPVATNIVPITTTTSKLTYLFPSLMMLVIMFVSIMLSSTLVVSEKLSPARFRLFTTPASDLLYISSHFLTTLIVAVLQIGIIFAAAYYVFDLSLGENITTTILIAILGAIIFTSIGMIIGYLFADEQTTILGAICVGTAFILVSDLFLPLEAVPEAMRDVLVFTPFVILTNLLRRALLFGSPLFNMTPQLYFAFIYAVFLFVLIIVAHKLLKIKYFFSMSKTGKRR